MRTSCTFNTYSGLPTFVRPSWEGQSGAPFHCCYPALFFRAMSEVVEFLYGSADAAEAFARTKGLASCRSCRLVKSRWHHRLSDLSRRPARRGSGRRKGPPRQSSPSIGLCLAYQSRCGDLIIVTQSGTTFSATYGKSKDEPNVNLLAATEGRDAERQALNQFRADAFGAATNKARELGWIV